MLGFFVQPLNFDVAYLRLLPSLWHAHTMLWLRPWWVSQLKLDFYYLNAVAACKATGSSAEAAPP